jgi:AraC-like DNA-binding protein
MEEQAILQDIFFVILYGGVIMLDTVASLYLLLRRANAIAPEVTSPVRLRRWAALFLIALALSHVFWILYALAPSPIKYLTVCGLDILLYIPTIAGILLSMLQDRHRPSWPVLVAMVPVILMVAVGIIRKDDGVQNPLFYYVLFLFVLLMLYMCLSVQRYGRWLKDNYADLEHKEIRLSFLILAVFLLFFLLYSSTSEAPFHLYLLQIDNILIVGLLLWRIETLQQLGEPSLAEQAEEGPKNAAPAIPSTIGPLLQKHCEEGQLYLQHDLTLAHLAQSIGTNRYYLSQHFAQQGITYNAYINNLRIRHFVRLYHEAVANHRIFTAQQLAHESGFHSYSTFSATFKQNMGTTVTTWMHSSSE